MFSELSDGTTYESRIMQTCIYVRVSPHGVSCGVYVCVCEWHLKLQRGGGGVGLLCAELFITAESLLCLKTS